jgi:2-polyprenyl-3-methyl-5-hydroxy-6-metoxy-1,4-benzoquinol methylase
MCGGKGRLYAEAFGDALHRCSTCALIYRFPYPDRAEMVRRHQSESYAQHPYFAAGNDAAAGDGFNLHHVFLSLLLKYLPKGSKVLDVGAGTGDFVELGSSAFAMDAIEPSPYLAEQVRRRSRGEVFQGAFEEYAPAVPYDGVLLMDMIEHAADPRALLRQAAAVLKPGGLLFVCTVDSRSLLYSFGPLAWRASGVSRKAKYVLHRIFCEQHNWYFNRRVLSQVVQEAGFEIVEHQGYEFPLERLRENPIIVAGLRVIYALQGILGANTEQYLLARKRA